MTEVAQLSCPPFGGVVHACARAHVVRRLLPPDRERRGSPCWSEDIAGTVTSRSGDAFLDRPNDLHSPPRLPPAKSREQCREAMPTLSALRVARQRRRSGEVSLKSTGCSAPFWFVSECRSDSSSHARSSAVAGRRCVPFRLGRLNRGLPCWQRGPGLEYGDSCCRAGSPHGRCRRHSCFRKEQSLSKLTRYRSASLRNNGWRDA
jgi:hypothetical protein